MTSLEQGGMENGVCNIANGLKSSGMETHIACLERKGVFADRLAEPEKLSVLGKKNGFSLSAVWHLSRTLRRVRPHIIHTHNLGPLIYTALATLGGTLWPILHGEHSLLADWELKPNRIRQRRLLYRTCRAVHTVSKLQREELLPLASSSTEIHSIANGVDTNRFTPGNRARARERFGLQSDAIVIGLIGRFGPFKKHDLLLSAFDSLAQRYPNLHLLFIGAGGSEESRIHALAKNSIYVSRIHFSGHLADPTSAYQALDLLVIPSVNEGMSNVALESMSCATPVLANHHCGHEEIITHGKDGVITDLTTSAVIIEAIISALGNPDVLIEMGVNARAAILERFSLSKMLDTYREMYASLSLRTG